MLLLSPESLMAALHSSVAYAGAKVVLPNIIHVPADPAFVAAHRAVEVAFVQATVL